MILRFVKNNLLAKSLRNVLVIISCTVSILLMLMMVNISAQINEQFGLSTDRYLYILGGNCSETDLVLDGLFFYDMPKKRLAFTEYEQVKEIEGVKAAVPIAMADYVTGTNYRIIGTDKTFFEQNGKAVYAMASGAYLGDYAAAEHHAPIVLGANVASRLHLDVGATFTASHGHEESAEHKSFAYEVVGVLAYTGTAIDNAAYTHYEAIWASHAHLEQQEEGEEEEEENHAEEGFIHLVLLSVDMTGTNNLLARYQHATGVTLTSTIETLRNVFSLFGNASKIVVAIIVIVIVMAFNMLFLAMFTSVGERRRDVAILRALGSNRGKILATMIIESLVILTISALLGWLLSFAGLAIVGTTFTGMLGIVINPTIMCIEELYIILGSFGIGLLATLLPALMVYHTEPNQYLR
jgi:putative ABC transport system permease protein